MYPILTKEIAVTEEMLDYNGHVNNIVFIHWMQDVAIEHATISGCTQEVYQRLGVSWVARSHHIDYVQSALPGDQIVAKTWIADSRKVSCRRKYLFFRKQQLDQQLEQANESGVKNRQMVHWPLLAKAETEWVFVDFRSGRPMKIAPAIIDCFQMLGDSPDLEKFE